MQLVLPAGNVPHRIRHAEGIMLEFILTHSEAGWFYCFFFNLL